MSLTTTLHDLTAEKLVAYYPLPVAGSTLVQPSTDPNVYVNDPSYIKHLNEQAYQKYAVDVPNQYAKDRFSFAAKQWEANKSATNIPKPSYLLFDEASFNTWWKVLQDTYTTGNPSYGANAPPLFFVKLAPLPPDPVIIPEGDTAPPPVPELDGPIGASVPYNPGVYSASPKDVYPDGYVYAGPTGVYQKHVYSNPFTAGNTRTVWIKLGTS